MQKLSDGIKALASARSADIVTPITTGYVAAANYRLFSALVGIAAVAATKTVTVQFKQATDGSGTGAKNLNVATVITSPGGGWTTKDVACDAAINDLDDANGFGFIAVTISSNNTSATPGNVVLVGGDSRFKP